MPFSVRSEVPRITYFQGFEDPDKAPVPSYRWMPGEERVVDDEQMKVLESIPRFQALVEARTFSVREETKAKVGKVKLPAAADPAVAQKMFTVPPGA